MEIGFDQNSWRIGPQPDHGEGIEWHALRARLNAAYAARGALKASHDDRGTALAGSFDRNSARSVAAFGDTLADVNPTALADGKPEIAKDAGVAGSVSAGGRG